MRSREAIFDTLNALIDDLQERVSVVDLSGLPKLEVQAFDALAARAADALALAGDRLGAVLDRFDDLARRPPPRSPSRRPSSHVIPFRRRRR